MKALLKIKEKALGIFGENVQYFIARAPGRVNLIGEHTDYNKGLVLPSAIEYSMYFGFKPNATNSINIHALDLNETHQLDLNNLTKTEISWVDYLTGILLEFKKRDVSLTGFDCLISSDIPIGSGMSSSAAFDCAFILGLNHLYRCEFSKWEMVHISNASNNNFLGIKSGILDQFSSIFGQKNKVMFLDCGSLEFSYVGIPKSDYAWLLIDTCVKHNHLTSAYNTRVEECHSALASINKILPQLKNLSAIVDVQEISDVDFNSEVERNRATYIIEENARVRSFIEALENNDLITCGRLMYASHEGLAHKYEVSCAELDFLVKYTKAETDVLGARMMGGGFGGCTINLIKRDRIADFQKNIFTAYKDKLGIEAKFYPVEIGNDIDILYYNT